MAKFLGSTPVMREEIMALALEVVETSDRLLGYAQGHCQNLVLMESENAILYSFDHFLLTLIAAQKTFAEDISGNDLSMIPNLADLQWVIEARNCLAHRAINVLEVKQNPVVIKGEQVVINGEDVVFGYEVQLLPCKTQNLKAIATPTVSLIDLCNFALRFWLFAYEQRKQNAAINLADINVAFLKQP